MNFLQATLETCNLLLKFFRIVFSIITEAAHLLDLRDQLLENAIRPGTDNSGWDWSIIRPVEDTSTEKNQVHVADTSASDDFAATPDKPAAVDRR